MQGSAGYPTPDVAPTPRAGGGFSPAFPADRAPVGATPGMAPPGGFPASPDTTAEAPRGGVGRGQEHGFGMAGGTGIARGGMGGSGGMAGGPMAGAGMPGGGMGEGMTMGRASGSSAGASPQYDRRLDSLEKRLDGLIRDVRTLKQLAEAQRQQETLLQDLVTELKQLRQSQQKPRESGRP